MKNRKSKTKVLVALSGGVDSSVAAALLVKSGKYDVTAAYMVNFDNGKGGNDSCWVGDYRDAVRVAAYLGIPILKLDFRKEYGAKVLSYMFNEYNAGRTPNPDVMCNEYIKFGAWLEKAREMGFEYLATGHYARLKREIPNSKHQAPNKIQIPVFKLIQAKDENKDQTYFLHRLNQEQLSHTLFPVGNYTKPQVRKLADKYGLPTAEKEESMGICFVGEVPMKEFLKMNKVKSETGNVVMADGTVVGKHEGLAFYTIGERHIGLQTTDYRLQQDKSFKSAVVPSPSTVVGENKPLFVVAKNLEKNELVVGFDDDPLLCKKEIEIKNVHWVGQIPKFPLKCEVRLRHRQPLQKATIGLLTTDHRLHRDKSAVVRSPSTVVRFTKPQRAVTPGQFAVFYKNGECLGGGEIV